MSVSVKDMFVMVKDMSVMVPQSTLSFRYILMIFWPTEGHTAATAIYRIHPKNVTVLFRQTQ